MWKIRGWKIWNIPEEVNSAAFQELKNQGRKTGKNVKTW